MERSKQIQYGLLGLLGVLLVVNLTTSGGIKSLFTSDASSFEAQASAVTTNASGNIPGTNVTSTQVPVGATTTIQYEQEKFNFGMCDEGEIVKHSFKFKNTGSEPLIISNCKGSCGCTVPTWPKEPVAPGATGEIRIEFNSKGKPGAQNKRVTVTANTIPSETFLEIAGEVRGKEMPAAKGGK